MSIQVPHKNKLPKSIIYSFILFKPVWRSTCVFHISINSILCLKNEYRVSWPAAQIENKSFKHRQDTQKQFLNFSRRQMANGKFHKFNSHPGIHMHVYITRDICICIYLSAVTFRRSAAVCAWWSTRVPFRLAAWMHLRAAFSSIRGWICRVDSFTILFSHFYAAWLSLVLNARLLKTNLLPIIKIRAGHEKKKCHWKESKVKIFHSNFCGNCWKSSVTAGQKVCVIHFCTV